MKRNRLLAFAAGLLLLPAALPLRAAAPVVQIPVVLDVYGIGGSHFTSDLTIVNLGDQFSFVEFTYIASQGAAAGSTIVSDQDIGSQDRLYIPDVISYLRARGASFPLDASTKVGTLLIRLPGLPDGAPAPYTGSRISTPNNGAAGGSFGTYSVGAPVGNGATGRTALYGLRENENFRTNLAVVHAGGLSGSPIDLRIVLHDGVTGAVTGDAISVTLQPGQWKQLSSVLAASGIQQGWAEISRSFGTDKYLAYAVVNDGGASGGGTSDGTWIDVGATDGMLPIVLSSGSYKTELVLTNDSNVEVTATLNYVGADGLGGPGIAARLRVPMPPRTQIIEPDTIAYIRRLGFILPPEPQGGTLLVTGPAALARVYSTNPDTVVGGTFGLSFPAVPAERRALTEAFVYGLRQDEFARSNVAVANTVALGETNFAFEVAIYSPTSRLLKTFTRNLKPGQWYQWNSVLADSGSFAGYARVRCTTPLCQFIAYGVNNDGSVPGAGTSDGSYIPMVNPK
ncbi:MAG: hypothetical protein ABIT01_09665 [Thermoanaerobaculia bacterium]